jgi:hypothetical protein
MALTDIVSPPGNNSTLYFNRGNIGVLIDIQATQENTFELPEVESAPSGGNIFIMSE